MQQQNVSKQTSCFLQKQYSGFTHLLCDVIASSFVTYAVSGIHIFSWGGAVCVHDFICTDIYKSYRSKYFVLEDITVMGLC